jgi:hypothetical protein
MITLSTPREKGIRPVEGLGSGDSPNARSVGIEHVAPTDERAANVEFFTLCEQALLGQKSCASGSPSRPVSKGVDDPVLRCCQVGWEVDAEPGVLRIKVRPPAKAGGVHTHRPGQFVEFIVRVVLDPDAEVVGCRR